MTALVLTASFLTTASVFAEANYVYHERTTSNPGCGGQYVDVLVPTSAQAVNLRFKVEFQFYTDNARVYYTTDGSTPSGAFGVGSGTTAVVSGSYVCTFGSPLVDVIAATIPAQAGGKTIKYIVSAWHSGGGAEIFANGPGAPCGCGTPTSSSALATVFQYTVQDANPTWDGGASPDGNWSNGANWVLNGRPTSTGATLTFAGSAGLMNANDCVTALNTTGTALTFASGAGSFVLSGSAITMGSGGGGGQTIIQQNSANNQEIGFPINLSGGNGDRSIVFGSGAGSLTLSGNINFGTGGTGDWLFPTTTAGTIILSGNNTGDGKGTVAITAGSNIMRAMMRNNVAGTQLTLGSDTCLGNSGSGSISAGTASFRGILANAQLNLNTTGGNRNLAGSTLAINANNITFNGANNLTIGDIIVVGGNRDFVVSSSGQVTVQDGICLSQDQTGRQLYLNLSGAGGMVVNGKIYDTFNSGGVTSGSSTLRKAGTGTLALNGSSSYAGLTQIDAGVLVLGNTSAIGTGTLTLAGGNLDSSVANLVNANNNAQNWNSDFTFVGSQNLNLGTGAVTPSASRQVTVSANTLTVGGAIGGGAIALTKAGNGTLALSGVNTYSGATTINAGTLTIGGAGQLGSGSYSASITDNSALNYNSSAAQTLSGLISGTGSLTQSGSGTLTLSGANTCNGGTTLSAGQLNINNSGSSSANSAIGTGTFTISGGTIDNTTSGDVTLAPNNAQNWNGDFTYAGSVHNLNLGTGAVTPNASRQVTVNANTLTVGGAIGGGAIALTKTGGGTLALNGVNTYSGGTTIKAGKVSINDANGLGATTGTVTLGDASGAAVTVTVNGASAAANIDQPVTVAGTGVNTISGIFNDGGKINLLRGLITLSSQNLTINSTAASGWRIQAGVTGSGNLTIQANGSGSIDMRTVAINNIGTIMNAGTGTGVFQQGSAISFGANVTSLIQNSTSSSWQVNQPNANFVGTAQVLAGTMRLQNASALSVNNVVSVASGAMLDVQDVTQTIAGLNDVSGSGGTVTDTTGSTVRTLTLGGSGNYSFSGVITATTPANMALAKNGAGTQTLSGNNSYDGLTTISSGMLKLGHVNALGSAVGATILSGGTLDLNGITTAETLNVTGNSTLANSSGTAGGLSADANLTANLIVNATGDISATRLIGTGAIRTITKDGVGTLTTSGTSHNNLAAWQINQGTVVFANTSGYGADRGVTISGGTLKLSGANFDLINNGEAFTVNSGVFDLNGKNEAVASIGGTGGLIRNGASSTASTLYVGGGLSGGSSASYAGVIENGSGTLALTKEGSGTQTLTGANTYTGNTTISAGTLLVNNATGSGTGSGAVSVSSGGTLGGNGTINGAVTVNSGGTLAPGTAAIGTLTLGSSLSLSGNANFRLNKSGATLTSDKIAGATSITAGGTLNVTASGDALVSGNSFSLLNTGTGSSWFSGVSLPTLATGLTWDTNNLATSGVLEVYGFTTNAVQTMVALKDTATTLLASKLTAKTTGARGTVTVNSVNSASSATVTISGENINYTPPSGFTGTDTFSAVLSDGHGSITATVVVTVSAANVGPSLTPLPGAYGTFKASGIPNQTYVVEFSTSMNGTWANSNPPTVTATGNGLIDYTDNVSVADHGNTVFYRLKQP